MIPYGRQTIESDDIQAVEEVLRSDFLTTGPKVEEFERALATYCDAKHAVVVSSGTAALWCAYTVARNMSGSKFVVPTMTFVATASMVAKVPADLCLVDVLPGSLTIDPEKLPKKFDVLVAMDYAGLPCDYDALRRKADDAGALIVADACHSLGATRRGKKVGMLADITCFSFHPLKTITTGEGGACLTDNDAIATALRAYRDHGRIGGDCMFLSFNFRLSDVACALGISQLKKADRFVDRRNEIARMYGEGLREVDGIEPLDDAPLHSVHARHLYVVRVDKERANCTSDELRAHLLSKGIQTQVHYKPVHMQSAYGRLPRPEAFPVAEKAYEEILSLPIYPSMTDEDVNRVIDAIKEATC